MRLKWPQIFSFHHFHSGTQTGSDIALFNVFCSLARWGLANVRMEFVKEGLTFTGEDSPMANLMLSVMGAFAEFERALIRERQREGIVLAKQRGAYRGRKKSLNSEQIAKLKQRVAAGDQKTLVAHDFGISRETLYQYLRED